jgi:hypothetical protein
MRYPWRFFVRLPLCLGAHFRPSRPMHDTTRPPICDTFVDYVTILPMWERDILVHTLKKPLAAILYQLLLQKDATLMSSAIAAPLTIVASPVWYLALTRKSYGNAKTSREVTHARMSHLPTLLFDSLPSFPGHPSS